MEINWNKITPTDFEELCCELLLANGFSNIQWYGIVGSDKGRDIVCTKAETTLPGALNINTWVVQCKRLITSRLTKDDMMKWLAACEEHKPDNVLLILTRVLSANLKDWLKGIAHKYSFNIHLWEENILRHQFYTHKDKIRKNFPKIVKTGKKVLFYKRERGEMHLGCNELEEVEIVLVNVKNYKEAIEKAWEFVDFIKANDIVFAQKEYSSIKKFRWHG
jgi:hypothetical protein